MTSRAGVLGALACALLAWNAGDVVTPRETVHFRVVAEGALGTTYGEDATFVAE